MPSVYLFAPLRLLNNFWNIYFAKVPVHAPSTFMPRLRNCAKLAQSVASSLSCSCSKLLSAKSGLNELMGLWGGAELTDGEKIQPV